MLMFQTAVQTVIDKYGQLDCLINNAGISKCRINVTVCSFSIQTTLCTLHRVCNIAPCLHTKNDRFVLPSEI